MIDLALALFGTPLGIAALVAAAAAVAALVYLPKAALPLAFAAVIIAGAAYVSSLQADLAGSRAEASAAKADAAAKGKALVVAHGRIAEQRPAVEAYHRLADADGTWCITDAAKALGIRPKDLSKHLRDEGWVYTRGNGKRLLAHQHRLNDGNLVHKTTVVPDADGEDQAYTQVRVTAKGLAKLATAFAPRFPGM